MDGAVPASALSAPTSRVPTPADTRPTRPRTRSARAGAGLFFQLRPALIDPLLDGCIVALHGLASRPLPTPAQLLAQDVPDIAWVVDHAGEPLDHLGHALQSPHIGDEAVGLSAFGQGSFHLGQLRRAELAGSSHAARCTQRSQANRPPLHPPLGNGLMRNVQLTSYFRRDHTAPKQVRGMQPALFHLLQIAPRPRLFLSRACPLRLTRNLSGHAPSLSPNLAAR